MLLPKIFVDSTLPYGNLDAENRSPRLMETDSQWNRLGSLWLTRFLSQASIADDLAPREQKCLSLETSCTGCAWTRNPNPKWLQESMNSNFHSGNVIGVTSCGGGHGPTGKDAGHREGTRAVSTHPRNGKEWCLKVGEEKTRRLEGHQCGNKSDTLTCVFVKMRSSIIHRTEMRNTSHLDWDPRIYEGLHVL